MSRNQEQTMFHKTRHKPAAQGAVLSTEFASLNLAPGVTHAWVMCVGGARRTHFCASFADAKQRLVRAMRGTAEQASPSAGEAIKALVRVVDQESGPFEHVAAGMSFAIKETRK